MKRSRKSTKRSTGPRVAPLSPASSLPTEIVQIIYRAVKNCTTQEKESRLAMVRFAAICQLWRAVAIEKGEYSISGVKEALKFARLLDENEERTRNIWRLDLSAPWTHKATEVEAVAALLELSSEVTELSFKVGLQGWNHPKHLRTIVDELLRWRKLKVLDLAFGDIGAYNLISLLNTNALTSLTLEGVIYLGVIPQFESYQLRWLTISTLTALKMNIFHSSAARLSVRLLELNPLLESITFVAGNVPSRFTNGILVADMPFCDLILPTLVTRAPQIRNLSLHSQDRSYRINFDVLFPLLENLESLTIVETDISSLHTLRNSYKLQSLFLLNYTSDPVPRETKIIIDFLQFMGSFKERRFKSIILMKLNGTAEVEIERVCRTFGFELILS